MLTKKLAFFLFSFIFYSSSVFATNGDNMIGFGAVSTAMGGTGIANPMGAESVLKNPALLAPLKKFEMNFAGTYFSPNLKTQDTMRGAGFGEKKSSADTFLIPSIGLSDKLNENVSLGLGAYGTSGLGADFRDTTANDGLFRMSTSLSTMKFTPAASYKYKDFYFGFGLPIMYGSLGISFDRGALAGNVGSEGAGNSSDIGIGADFGFAYNVSDFWLGFNYQSPISMEYKHQLKEAASKFGASSVITSDKLEQPAEYGVGVAYKYKGLMSTFDFKLIQWKKAEGYDSFGWENQKIYALGLAYEMEQLTLRAGYNYGKSPLGDAAINNAVGSSRQAINAFNLVGFPAVVESHYTLGGGYKFSGDFNLDLAYVYVPEKKVSSPGLSMVAGQVMSFSVKHSQSSLTLAGKWMF